ncbi:MAG: hypothetical protein Q7S51_11945 [Gallionellaceae bacterium]|nr:hypothetical protein [Gallionellaceae bacterium]
MLVAFIVVYFTFAHHYEWLGLATVNGLVHAAINLFLLWFFGRSLFPPQEPLITRIVRRVHGEITPDILVYTRRVTLAWCIFFTAQIVFSILLLGFASLDNWSFFINILNLPLLLLMFLAEYIYRAISYPNRPRTSLSAVVRAYAQEI